MIPMIPMTRIQKARAYDLYKVAKEALEALANERLNLAVETRDALNDVRGALECFDSLRGSQPVEETPVASLFLAAGGKTSLTGNTLSEVRL